MKTKRTQFNLFLFMFLVFFTCAFSIALNNKMPVLKTSDTLDEEITDTYYTINFSSGKNDYVFYSDHVLEDLTLLAVNSQKSDIFFNDVLLKDSSTSFRRPIIIQLNENNYDRDAGEYRFSLEVNGNPGKIRLYIGSLNQMQMAISFFDFLTTMSIGVLIAMLINGCSLALFKPSEKYIRYYCFYIFILFIWTCAGANIQPLESFHSILSKFTPYMYTLLMISCSIVCFKISDIPLSKYISKLDHPLSIFMITILMQIFSFFLPNSISDIFKFSLSLIGILALIKYADRKNRMSYLLLSSYAITQGLRLLPQLADKSFFTESLITASLRASHIFDMPFAFVCLITINYRFAQAFKKSEKQAVLLEEMNQELDKKVEIRTQELIAAETTRHNMMTNVFHDLRSPLFVLKGCLDMMKISNENQEILDIMKERLHYITQLVEDLFLIAKLEDKKVLFNYDKINLTQLVHNSLSSFQISAEKKQIKLHAELEEDIFCWGDSIRISQAISNLITNAIIYTQQSGCITIKLSKNENRCFLSVTDTGKGIKKDEIEKIFTKYYIVQDNGNKKSSGLGLSIAQEIIKQHQGQITVISELNKGSTFTIELPILEK